MTDALNRQTSYTYDNNGNVLTRSRTGLAGTPSSVTEYFAWTSDYNQISTYTDGLGHTTEFGYTNGCLTQVNDPLGHATNIICTPTGQPLTITDALNHTTTFGYQGYDLSTVSDALGRTTTFTTDQLGRQVAVADPSGRVSRLVYDPNNDWADTLVDPSGTTTTIQHDAMGDVQSVTLPPTVGSAMGGTISYQYNARNWPKQRTDALNQPESWTYDGTGDVQTHTDRKGQMTQYTYDALDRRSETLYADGSNVVATYDAGNRPTELDDSANGIQQFAWNGLDELTTQISPQGTVSYQYDAAGRRTSMTAGAQATVSYTYDNANRLAELTQGGANVVPAFDNANRLQQLTLPNGVTQTYSYDNANEVTAIAYAQSGGASLGDLAYTYDIAGQRTSQTGTMAPDVLPTATTQAGTFDLNNRQTGYDSAALTYDADGNLTSDGTNTYVWNARNQLTQIQQGATAIASYTYDAMGRRQSKSLNGGTATSYLYDGINPVQESQGTVVTPILTGLGVDQYFARPEAAGAAYFLTDDQGSTIGLTNSSGALIQQYQYSPYGEATASNAGTSNPYQYTGRENDGDGLYYYRARYYSPLMKRFLSEDPVGFTGGQGDFYAYVGGNPVSSIDPNGECPWCLAGAIVGGISGVVGALETGASWQDAAIAGVVGAGAGFVIAAAAPLELGAFAAGGLSGVVGAFGNFTGQEVGNLINGRSIACVNVGAIIGDGLGAAVGGFLMAGATGSTAAVVVGGANSGQLESVGAAIGQKLGGGH